MFSTSQFISLFILAAGVGTILLCGYLGKKRAAGVDKEPVEENSAIITEEAEGNKTENTEE